MTSRTGALLLCTNCQCQSRHDRHSRFGMMSVPLDNGGLKSHSVLRLENHNGSEERVTKARHFVILYSISQCWQNRSKLKKYTGSSCLQRSIFNRLSNFIQITQSKTPTLPNAIPKNPHPLSYNGGRFSLQIGHCNRNLIHPSKH